MELDKKLYKKAFLESFLTPDVMHVGQSIASHIAAGVGLHVGTNAAIKYLRSGTSSVGNMLTKSLGELGVKHGIQGRSVHPMVMDRIQQLVGPEMVAEYTGARSLVSKGRNLIPNSVPKLPMSAANKAINSSVGSKVVSKASEYPVFGGIASSLKSVSNNGGEVTQHPGFKGKIVNGVTTLMDKASTREDLVSSMSPLKKKLFTGGRILANAGTNVAALASGVPGLVDNTVINTVRQGFSMMPKGGKLIKDRVAAGYNGAPESKVKSFLGNYLFSPTAWGEAKDFGAMAKKDGIPKPALDKFMNFAKPEF